MTFFESGTLRKSVAMSGHAWGDHSVGGEPHILGSPPTISGSPTMNNATLGYFVF